MQVRLARGAPARGAGPVDVARPVTGGGVDDLDRADPPAVPRRQTPWLGQPVPFHTAIGSLRRPRWRTIELVGQGEAADAVGEAGPHHRARRRG